MCRKIIQEFLKEAVMNRQSILGTFAAAVLFSVVFTSCKKEEHQYHTVIDKIEAESQNYQGTSISSDQYLSEINLIEITEGDHTFLIPERKSQIKSFECNECHSKPIEELKGEGHGQKAHWDLTLIHANKSTMNCATCHDGSNMDELKSLTGVKIDFNNSYNLCSQCHSKQFDDWKGGAHGKRMESWAPPRASLTCVNCHNPHDPSFDSRWPARFNTQTEDERK